MQERIFIDADACSKALTDDVVLTLSGAIETGGGAVLVVPGGNTPSLMLHHLARRELNWSRITVLATDERRVPVDHQDSNEGMIRRHLPADMAFLSLLDNQASRLVADLPHPFDMVILGMGADGHIASLFPGTSWRTAGPGPVVDLSVPGKGERISLTLPAILQARQIALLFAGADKVSTWERARSDDGTDLPVRALIDGAGERLTVYRY
ncbi:6-phosphogluconolactonase [Radicibacter daui]|uniref:6-phosphogluconolactonase n=1 Tax=Radicibacter daui TaxID=3064829 RepID=UPI004046904E